MFGAIRKQATVGIFGGELEYECYKHTDKRAVLH